jgi:hypothetical protein
MKIESSRREAAKVTRTAPETIYQAQKWDKNKSLYLRAGFCEVCAAQATWGHQLGFSHVKPPCASCTGRVVPGQSGVRAAKWAAGEGGDPS